ncbi:F-type H+-transporting ATPase subunit epsilon [Antricoccus suffuscus]|uniref:ATP synthase epsilon chain n=1 Tax=Antricoccus suffuscus TaxID=1629062 RepID=A0A2T1A479_9ACTN|nr:F0F1 ATP synthase subunit epsilon [Antricoccus suffuscus]PRZ43399.1 F-type H+-transporting ATPase subunit epsilon [Antricoccus suffuscus]
MPLKVELVSVERLIWSGEADMVIARTTEGELGIMPGHAPVLGQLSEDQGVVQIHRTGESNLIAAVHGGFLSVTAEGVSILAETAELSDEIDVQRAERALDRAGDGESPDQAAAAARANARLTAASKSRS